MMSLDTPQDRVRKGQPCCILPVLFVATASATILALSAAYPSSSFPYSRLPATSRAVFAGVTDAARRLPANHPSVMSTWAAVDSATPTAKAAALKTYCGNASIARGKVRTGLAAASGTLPDPAVAAYIARYSPEQAEYIADLLFRHFGKDALLWAIIVRRESGYNITARNRSTHCYGLFQLHPCHRRALERADGDWHSVEDQAAWAAQMYRSQGTRPWAVAGAAKRELSKLGE
jgi:hypothetical protein